MFLIPGVSVLEKNTTNGVAADFDGNYSIEVSGENAILVFSSIGFVTQEITVGQSATIDVTLTEATQSLEEVVVTALGIKKREKSIDLCGFGSRGGGFNKS